MKKMVPIELNLPADLLIAAYEVAGGLGGPEHDVIVDALREYIAVRRAYPWPTVSQLKKIMQQDE